MADYRTRQLNSLGSLLPGLLQVVFLVGCAGHPLQPPDEPVAARCLRLYAELDAAVVTHGTTPSSPARIDGFPYLRIDRFLADFREEALTPTETAAWLTHLSILDRQARRVEWASLPADSRTELNRRHAPGRDVPAVLEHCADTLRAADLADPSRLAALRERTQVPDEYQTAHQVLGLYPVIMVPVDYGVFRYQTETRALFAQPLTELPVLGELRRYGPPPALRAPFDLTSIRRDALGIPEPTPAQLATLFASHAPIWEIDVASDVDQPGSPRWSAGGIPTVETSKPAVYLYASYLSWQSKPLLQLNYLLWFAARPKTGVFDLLGGSLDGVLWRVTLDSTGQPLLYDSIHACGCYHLLFPGPKLHLRAATAYWAEPPLAPQPAPTVGDHERVIIRLSSGSHYVQRVYADRPGSVVQLDTRDYATLYAVPAADGELRSLFDSDGLVAGSERAERWLLWPTGVPSPGAMRERGRHAIAFVGRRHFDDADLLDRLFEPAKEER